MTRKVTILYESDKVWKCGVCRARAVCLGKDNRELIRKRHSFWSGIGCASRLSVTTRLLYLNFLSGLIQRALHAHALAFELRDIRLMIDVVGLAGIVLQNVLVALLFNGSGEDLAVSSLGSGSSA